MNGLCAALWIRYLPDILVGVFFLIMIIISACRGFVGCILTIVSSVLAVLLAITLAGAFADATGGLFGLQEAMSGGITNTFLKLEGFDVDVSQAGVKEALKSQNVSAVISRLVIKVAGKQDEIAAGTTLAMLLGQAMGSLATRLIAGVLIFIGIKVIIFLLRKVLGALFNRIPVLGKLNHWLGALFGLLYSLIVVSAILAVLAVIPIKAISAYFAKTLFVGFLYEHNFLVMMLSWFL